MANEEIAWEVFVSYRNDRFSDDKTSRSVALDIKNIFEQQLFVSTFIDQHHMLVNDDFMQKIKEQVANSHAVICVLSHEFFESQFCTTEYTQAKLQRKLFSFSASSAFNPADNPLTESERGSIPFLTDWDRTLKDPAFRRHISPIVQKIGRPGLVALAEAIASEDEDAILEWCERHPEDRASKEYIGRIFLQRLQTREAINRDGRKNLETKIAKHLRVLQERLDDEQRALDFMREKVRRRADLSVADCRHLSEDDAVQLENIDQGDQKWRSLAETMATERDEAFARAAKAELELKVALADKAAGAAHIEKLLSQVKAKQREIERISKKLVELANPDGDVVADILTRLDQRMAGPCKDNVRQAGNYLKSANASHADADRLQRMVEDAIRSGRSKVPPGKPRNGHVIHYVEADDSSRARYMGRVELPKLRGTSIQARRYWGYFDDFPKFKGPGVIHFHDGADHVFSYFGELENLAPEGGACGVFTSERSGLRFTRWEGSWPKPLGFGRLVLSDGTHFYGKVRMSDFGEFLEDDHGVLAHNGPNSKGELYSHGFWQMGQKHPGR